MLRKGGVVTTYAQIVNVVRNSMRMLRVKNMALVNTDNMMIVPIPIFQMAKVEYLISMNTTAGKIR